MKIHLILFAILIRMHVTQYLVDKYLLDTSIIQFHPTVVSELFILLHGFQYELRF